MNTESVCQLVVFLLQLIYIIKSFSVCTQKQKTEFYNDKIYKKGVLSTYMVYRFYYGHLKL